MLRHRCKVWENPGSVLCFGRPSQFLICTVALTACSLKGAHAIFNVFIFNQCQMLRYNNGIKHTAHIFQKKSPRKHSLAKLLEVDLLDKKERKMSQRFKHPKMQLKGEMLAWNQGLNTTPSPLCHPSALNKALHTDVLPSRSTLTAFFPVPCKYPPNISRRILPLYVAEKSDVTSCWNTLQVLLSISTGLSSNQACSVTSRKKDDKKKNPTTKLQNKVRELLLLTARPESTLKKRMEEEAFFPSNTRKAAIQFSALLSAYNSGCGLWCAQHFKSDLDPKQKSLRETLSCLPFC